MQKAKHRIFEMEPGLLVAASDCKRCQGRGYHYGFGEHGHDPDWCLDCGGPGDELHDLLTPPET